MPLQHARRLLDAHAAPILDHLTAAGFRVTRRYDHQAGSLPRLLLCAPNNHPPVLALSSVRALAELSGDGILLYQERIARAARTTIRKSTKRFHVSRLVGTGATCRPCGFEGGFRMVPLHVESEAHRQQVWTAFSEAFPATRTIV
jgi:hypothetical protein